MLKIPFDQYMKDLSSFNWCFNHHRLNTIGTNETLIKADPTLLFGVTITPVSGLASNVFLKIHNTSLVPVAGSTPVMLTVGCLSNTSVRIIHHIFPTPILLDKGLAYSFVLGLSDDSASPITSANILSIDLIYR